MSNASKQKGSAWERRLVEHLQANGFPCAERRVTEGRNDRGDVSGVPGWVLEAKACKRLELSKWIDEAEKEAGNADADRFAVVFPRRSHAASKAFVLMTLNQLTELMGPSA